MFLVHMEFGEKLAIFNQKNLKAEKKSMQKKTSNTTLIDSV